MYLFLNLYNFVSEILLQNTGEGQKVSERILSLYSRDWFLRKSEIIVVLTIATFTKYVTYHGAHQPLEIFTITWCNSSMSMFNS